MKQEKGTKVMKPIQAVKDKIIAIVVRETKTTESGLIIPETANKEPQGYGEVVSVGEEIKTIEKGDLVLFHKQGGQDIILDGKIIKVLGYGEIYGIVKRGDKE